MLPREKALNYGIGSLSNLELICLIVKSGYKDRNVFEVVDEILDVCNGFNNLLSLTYEELINIKGINKAKALEIMAILEIASRLTKIDEIKEENLDRPEKVVDWLKFKLGYSNQEQFFIIYLNGRGKVIKSEVLYKGSKNASTIAIDEILRKAILLKSSGIIVSHNHPSGNIKPSSADIDVTNKLIEACKLIGIPLLDHLIVSKNDYFSFKNNGLC